VILAGQIALPIAGDFAATAYYLRCTRAPSMLELERPRNGHRCGSYAMTHTGPEPMATISVTRLRLRSARYLLGFIWYALRALHQARGAPGNRGAEVRRFGGAFWTLTRWDTPAAARAFMLAPPHRAAMSHLKTWCDEASLVQWEDKTDRMPSWEIAAERLARDGRISHVTYPSRAQAAGAPIGSATR
jgi:hypothetical protein